MTKFEQIGVTRQYEATTKSEAIKSFAHSCDVCCNKGMRLDCDKCTIAYTNKLVVACFNDMEKGGAA